MKCPKCNEEMKIMWYESPYMYEKYDIQDVVGHCSNCGYDGTWQILRNLDTGIITEGNFQRYFFG